MIIFDLDSTLADCEHRRHFVDPEKNENFFRYNGNDFRGWKDGQPQLNIKWQPDWQAFYEACDKDEPILQVHAILRSLWAIHDYNLIEIWSGRCESVREKTEKWLIKYGILKGRLKMRPVGDSTPDDELKERWLDEYINDLDEKCPLGTLHRHDHGIDFVFDDRPKVIRMWRRRGIFVFNCCQHDEEF